MSEPEMNSEASGELVVGESDLASCLSNDPKDSFPPVFATARMVGLIEIAAARLLRPLLQQGELSVGVSVEVTHSAATPRGTKVKATARYLGREGKLFKFEVVAEDSGGEIGRGTHKRAVVSEERLVSGA